VGRNTERSPSAGFLTREYLQLMTNEDRSNLPAFMSAWWWNLSFGLLGIWIFTIPTVREARSSDPSVLGIVLGSILTLLGLVTLGTGIRQVVRWKR
jgi:hypothetical protein